MPTRIDQLTPEQHARMGSFAQEWIQKGWRTTPLTEEEWAVWEAGARRCYEFAGIPWPGVVVRVSSPIVGAFAAPLAALAIAKIKNGAVRGAVDDAVDGDQRRVLESLWYHRFGGTIWAGWWQSYIAYFRDVAELQLPGDLWDRSRAYDDAQSAGWWWPFRDFVMVCDVPAEIHVEQVRPTGWGSHRLHREDGPAVVWADGWGVYSWHGTRVPADLIETDWSTERIFEERNAEIRRCAIEKIGWAKFAETSGMTMVGKPVLDPGNAPHNIALFDLPEKLRDMYEEKARILICTNGSPERDGTRHQFGLVVPGHHTNPIEAAADLYGVPPAAYAQLQVRR